MGRQESEAAFLSALEELLTEGRTPGINALADAAGLNKVLIYRYFGGWDGLLEEYARKINLWRSIREELAAGLDTDSWSTLKEAVAWVFITYRERLRSSPVYLRILKDELSNPNPLSRKLEAEREEEGQKLTALLAKSFPEHPEIDWYAFGAFITGGLTYLILKATNETLFNGVELSTDEGWRRIDSIWKKMF